MLAQRHLYDTAAEVTVTDSPDNAAELPDDTESAPERSAATEEFWDEVRVDPVKLALPGGIVGYTLRAYRPASDVITTESAAEDSDEDELFAARERARAAEEAALAEAAEAAALAGVEAGDARATDDTVEEPAPEDFEDEPSESDEAAATEPAEDVPVFLSHRGRLLLFAEPESLVSFVTSDAPHDLTQLDTWSTVVKRIRAADIVPTDEDTYELDLVVENLRGGHDAWDLLLLISAGEIARDLGWALRIKPVVAALAAGSPLDDLDEAVRAAAAGGFSGMLARRRLRRIGAQQASLGWRTVIGKITAAVDWRD